jgi:hypothetical protein
VSLSLLPVEMQRNCRRAVSIPRDLLFIPFYLLSKAELQKNSGRVTESAVW